MDQERKRLVGAGLIIAGVGLVAFLLANPPDFGTSWGDVEAERRRFAIGVGVGAMLIVGGWFFRQEK